MATQTDQLSLASYADLSGKVALIMGFGQTPASSPNQWGNGAAVAHLLSKNNVKIFGCDINLEAAKHTQSRLVGPSEIMVADVTSSTDVSKAVNRCLDLYGRIDILINNVGLPIMGDAATLPEEAWDKQMNLNLKSVYLSCHLVIPIMEKQGEGVIVNNASIAGIRYLGKPQIAYNAAKAGVIHFTQATAAAFASKGVRLNCVAPGLMLTPLIEQMQHSHDAGQRHMYEKITKHNVPMGIMGHAFDVANAVAFLASDTSRYITGQTLVIDGGLTVSTGT